MAHSSRLSRIETGDRPWTFRGSRLEGVSPPCHLVHCRLCLPGGRKGHFSPLESALRYDRRNACPSRKLPAAGCCPFARSVTYQTRLRLCDVKSQCASPPYSTDAHAAANLDQIEEIDHMFDAVGLTCIVAQFPLRRPQPSPSRYELKPSAGRVCGLIRRNDVPLLTPPLWAAILRVKA